MNWRKEFEEYVRNAIMDSADDDDCISWEEEIEWKEKKLDEIQNTIHSLLKDKEYLLRIIRNVKHRMEQDIKSFKFDTEGYSDFKHIQI